MYAVKVNFDNLDESEFLEKIKNIKRRNIDKWKK